MTHRRHAASALLLFLAFVLAAQGAMAQTSYTLTVSTDKPSYVYGQAIQISGKVSPPPGPNTAVFLEIINPHGAVVAPGEAPVGASTGLYNYTLVAGGNSGWIAGTYAVNATWGAYPPQVSAEATFQYTPTAVTSTTSSTSNTSSSQSSSTSSTTTVSTSSSATTSASSTSSTKGGGGIPVFPFQAALLGVFVLAIVSAYLVMKRASVRGVPAVTR